MQDERDDWNSYQRDNRKFESRSGKIQSGTKRKIVSQYDWRH